MTELVCFRVTRFDPRHRAASGGFLGEDWTSVSDIGRPFNGIVLSRESYLAAEDAYVESVRRFVAECGIDALTVTDLETFGGPAAEAIADDSLNLIIRELQEGQEVRGEKQDAVIRANLRELIWCRLVGAEGFFVEFGYDYYMYVGRDGHLGLPQLPEGMFVEPACESELARRGD